MTKSCIKEKTVCLKPTQCKLTIHQYSIVFKERERKHKSPHKPTTQRQPHFGVFYYYFMRMHIHTHIYTHFKQKLDPMPFVHIHFILIIKVIKSHYRKIKKKGKITHNPLPLNIKT